MASKALTDSNLLPPASTRPDQAEHWQPIDRLHEDLVRLREAVDLITLPGFVFRAEEVGGRACLRVGMIPLGGVVNIYWGTPYAVARTFTAYDVAWLCLSQSQFLFKSYCKRHLKLDGHALMAKGQ